MADDPLPESETDDAGPNLDSEKYRKLLDKALRQFDAIAMPQTQVRADALMARRFVNVPGSMWDGSIGEQFENSPKPEVDKITESWEKIETDYRENRVMVDFKADTDGEDDTADTLNGLFRADAVHFGADEAWDNAFTEGGQGGFGAWRITTDYSDPYDSDDDSQRVNPGVVITDADQRVFFGPSNRYDKSDAPYVYILTADSRADAEEKWEGRVADWPMQRDAWSYDWDWYAPDVVYKAEYYEKEDVSDKLLIFTQKQSGEEQRFFETELDPKKRKEMAHTGWKMRTRSVKRCRVHKYILNGSYVLKDCGYIAGSLIPIVPFYGKRTTVDNVERFRGHVLKRMDMARIYNSAWARVLETNATSPERLPIVLDEQMDATMAQEWASRNIGRPAYLRIKAIRDADGNIVSGANVQWIDPPEIPQSTMVMLQAATADLADTNDNADEVKANVSADAMDIAAERVDAKSLIYLDNFRLSMIYAGKVYLGMASEVYYEKGRKIETQNVDGAISEATLQEDTVDPSTGRHYIANDFSNGRYKVTADVQESTATKRQKVVRQSLGLTQAAEAVGAQDIGQACLLNALMNVDGEGTAEIKDFARQKALAIGLVKPTPEEKQEIEQAAAQKQGQPDPQAMLLNASLQEAQGKAAQAQATAEEKQASAKLKLAQAEELAKAPAVPTGLSETPTHPAVQAANDLADVRDKLAGAELKQAQAAHLHSEIGRKRVATGLELRQAEHDREMREKEHALAERQADRPAA